MSVVVNINQNSKKTKKIGLKFLSGWLAFNNQYFGIPNNAYVLDTYQGGEDIRKQLFILFDKNKYGRGMSFFVDENYNVELQLNYPATKTDIEMFYKFIYNFCLNFKINSFSQEGRDYSLEQIKNLKEECILFNKELLRSYLNEELTIFGCIYPIIIENEFVNKIKKVSIDEAYIIYENYLDEKQKQDCYFAKPIIYNNPQLKKISAKYVLTENVPTIFPIETYLPYGYNQNIKDEISEWTVLLLKEKSGSFHPYAEISYSEFTSFVNVDNYPRFDAKHIILTFNNEMKYKYEKKFLKKSKLQFWFDDV